MIAQKKPGKIVLPGAEILAARQRREDRRSPHASASAARYSAKTDKIWIEMISGVEHRILRRLINELVNIPARVLAKELRVGVGGDVISVPSHDVDSALAGLLRDINGTNIQRLGGRVRSAAKAIAARANGHKGGRPRKSSQTS